MLYYHLVEERFSRLHWQSSLEWRVSKSVRHTVPLFLSPFSASIAVSFVSLWNWVCEVHRLPRRFSCITLCTMTQLNNKRWLNDWQNESRLGVFLTDDSNYWHAVLQVDLLLTEASISCKLCLLKKQAVPSLTFLRWTTVMLAKLFMQVMKRSYSHPVQIFLLQQSNVFLYRYTKRDFAGHKHPIQLSEGKFWSRLYHLDPTWVSRFIANHYFSKCLHSLKEMKRIYNSNAEQCLF